MSLVLGENCAWPGRMFREMTEPGIKRFWSCPRRDQSVSYPKQHPEHQERAFSPRLNHQERLLRMAAFRRELYRWQGEMPFQARDRHQHDILTGRCPQGWGLNEKAVVELKLQKGHHNHPPVSKENDSETLPVL